MLFSGLIVKYYEINVHHHHVPEGLRMFPVPWSSRWSWSLHLFLGRPMFLRPFGLYCSACFGSLFVSILCTCCNHFFWYYFISFTMFCTPFFCLIHWLFSLSSFVIPSKCLKNPTPTSTKALAAWPLGNAAKTAADGRGCRRQSSALKLGPFS